MFPFPKAVGYQEILITISLLVGIYGYIPYFRNMFKGKTKPHVFSWFIWAILTGIAFFWQLSDGAGLGARATGFASLVCGIITLYARSHGGQKYITKRDRYAFIGAGIAWLLRRITNNVLWSMILITLIDALGFFPTYRKGWYNPHSETAIMYMLNGLKFIFAIGAMAHFSTITILYPASLVLMNCSFAILLYVRRKQLLKKKPSKT